MTILKTAFSFSSDSIAPGSIPTTLSTPGMAGLSLSPQIAPSNQGYTAEMLGLSTLPQLGTNTNTAQSSSNNTPWYNYIPSHIASTVGNLISPITTLFYLGIPWDPPLTGG